MSEIEQPKISRCWYYTGLTSCAISQNKCDGLALCCPNYRPLSGNTETKEDGVKE